jgi:hypothetical protein
MKMTVDWNVVSENIYLLGNSKEPDERSPISVTISYFGYSLIASDTITNHRLGLKVGMPLEGITECKEL